MGALIGVLFVGIFSYLNAFVWGDSGYIVHLLNVPVPSYTLVWLWIAMIALICGFNYAVKGGQKHPVGYVIGCWWLANIGMITVLQYISFRGVEQAGESIGGMSSLMMDFAALGIVDLASIFIIWYLVSRGILTASFWLVVFCCYLIANLFGHAIGAHNLMVGINEDITAMAYDSYMYLTFTAMLLIQAIGSGSDALLRWGGSNVDIYRDIRPDLFNFINRHIHSSQNNKPLS